MIGKCGPVPRQEWLGCRQTEMPGLAVSGKFAGLSEIHDYRAAAAASRDLSRTQLHHTHHPTQQQHRGQLQGPGSVLWPVAGFSLSLNFCPVQMRGNGKTENISLFCLGPDSPATLKSNPLQPSCRQQANECRLGANTVG